MKLNKFFFAMAAAAVAFASCDKPSNNDGEFTETAPEFTSEVADIVVTEATLNDKVTFTCSPADFGVNTQINYSLEVALGADGLKSVVATSTTTTIETTLEKLNYELYVKLGITVGEPVDVYFWISAQMGESAKLYSQAKTAKITAIEAGPMKSEWGLVGTINGWAAPDITMFDVAPYYVAYNVKLEVTDEFKIRAGGVWDDTKNYGTEVKGTFAPNTIIPVITSGGSQNIGVKEAGIYDIYFDLENTTVYLMKAGKTPDQAGEAEVEYIDPSTDKFNVGFSGSVLGWDDPSFEAGDRASFKSKSLTDEATYAGTYTYELASITFAVGDEFKLRLNGAWVGAGEGGATVEGLTVSGTDNFVAGEAGTYKATITFDWDGLAFSNAVVTFSK